MTNQASSIHILCIEDDNGLGVLLKRRLERLGYVVDIAQDGAEGLQLYNPNTYDVLVVDQHLPGCSGLEVIQTLALNNILPPTIMVTGSGDESIAVEAMKLGAGDYIVKDTGGGYLELLPSTIEQLLYRQQLINEKQQAQEVLRQSEERYRTLVELSPDSILVYVQEVIAYINPAGVKLLGANSPAELIGHPILNIVHLPSHHHVWTNTDLVYAAQQAGEFVEEQLICLDGKIIDVEIIAAPIAYENKRAVQIIIRDITERKNSQAMLDNYLDRLAVLQHVSAELTRWLDIDYVLVSTLDLAKHWSQADSGFIAVQDEDNIRITHSIGAYPQDEIVPYLDADQGIVGRVIQRLQPEFIMDIRSSHYTSVIPDTVSQMAIPLISQGRLIGVLCLETKTPGHFTLETFEFIQLITTRVATALDNARLYAVSQQQIAELHKLYMEVSKLEQLKTDMIRVAAHDLRNPLNNILGFAELLAKSTLSDQQRGYIDYIRKSVKRMQNIITGILSLERIEVSAKDEFTEAVDLSELVREVFIDLDQQAQQKSQRYSLEIASPCMIVKGEAAQLNEAIANLIGNAIKYTPEQGSVSVRLLQDQNSIRFEVEDTGYGIPEDQQQKLFQPFFRAQTEETAIIDGTGLGLHLVKNIVERHKGQMQFQSTYGKGSKFGFCMSVSPH